MLNDSDETRQSRTAAHAAREALVGKTIAGRYILRGLLGHGGMGAVYEAEHVGLGKRAAIKFVDPEFATDEKVVARFAREARAMSAIESAHIVTVFDAGTEDGRPYLVMELLRGEDLGQRLRRLTRIPVGEAMHLIAQVLKGLARAHAAGIVHRDLKPDNIFLVKHDTDPLFAKIVDFGISKIERPRDRTSPLALTGRGTVLGTPFYMSPEQAQAAPDVDRRTDLYSVGAILFECLTGRPPHTGESYEQVILSICMRDAPDVRSIERSVPAGIAAFVARALARDRTDRFSSAEAMLAALHEVAPVERARVPLDPALAVNPLEATMLDGGSPVRSSRPSSPDESRLSAATRLGVGSLEPGGGGGAAGNAKADADAKASASANAKPRADADAKPRASDGGEGRASGERARPSRPKAKGKRPIGVALVTAVLATLTGVGVTFAVIASLDKRSAVTKTTATSIATTAAPSAAPSGSASVVPVATASAAASGPGVPVATASAAASESPSAIASAPGSGVSGARAGAPLSTASAKPVTPSTARSGGGVTAPLPRPSSTKPLDIQRDLP